MTVGEEFRSVVEAVRRKKIARRGHDGGQYWVRVNGLIHIDGHVFNPRDMSGIHQRPRRTNPNQTAA